ncbi:hypothetical protein PTMSG1_01616 [Pyrenophora teres f. maculata]|nr:hypothetical protein PTMSG1_01616 [Pyrenophora teres f. maculata]
MVLGNDEETCKPWLVVLCPKTAKKKVERFFQKDMAKRLCKSPGSGLVSFEVVVDRAPEMKGTGDESIGVISALSEKEGMPFVKVAGSTKDQIATLGGFVHITWSSSSEPVMFGLTAGHVIPSNVSGNFEEEVFSCGSDDGSTSVVSEEGTATDEEGDISSDIEEPGSVSVDTKPFQWSNIGQIANASYSHRALNMDWALIELSDSSITRLKKTSAASFLPLEAGTIQCSVEAEIHNNPNQVGHLSDIPASMILPSGSEFVRVHTLTLNEPGGVPMGYSGSWVTRKQNTELQKRGIYGMIVADDKFGDVYVIPMEQILADIKIELNADTVTLSTLSLPVTRLYESISIENQGIQHISNIACQKSVPLPTLEANDSSLRIAAREELLEEYVTQASETKSTEKRPPSSLEPESLPQTKKPRLTSVHYLSDSAASPENKPSPTHDNTDSPNQPPDDAAAVREDESINNTTKSGKPPPSGPRIHVDLSTAGLQSSKYYFHWTCCACGESGASVDMDMGCISCNNHWRCSGCRVYRIFL